MGGVADPDRLRSLVARQPGDLPFRQAPLAGEAVHDLELRRAAGDRAHQPGPPLPRLVVVAGVHQGQQRQGGVPDPAVAVVPVARAAELLRQRGGGGRDEAAGRAVGHRLQRDERAPDGLRPAAALGAAAGPLVPELLRVAQLGLRADRLGHGIVGELVGEGELRGLALGDGELADGPHVLAAQGYLGPQHHHVGTRDGAHGLLVDPRHPGDDRAVVEADHQLRPHLDPTASADDETDQVRGVAAERHEVDERDGTFGGLEVGLEDQRVVAVAAADARGRLGRGDQPAAVLGPAEQGREAGARVEPGPAQPVDGAVAANQGRRLAVPDQRVVLDAQRHGDAPFYPTQTPGAALRPLRQSGA